ncbi:MAG: MarR family transcriptional regulator [Bacteroidetes bacterium]|nr:MarR family transcriptional regulator [Bacteroidota bacterium]
MPNNYFQKGDLYSIINGLANTAITRRLQKNFKDAGLEITIEQWSVLYHLWDQNGLSQQELCNLTYRDKPSVTRLIDNLEKQKLVKRVASKKDRRKNIVTLTEHAMSLQKITFELANKTLDEALSGIKKADILIVKNVLHKVFSNLQFTNIQ